MSRQTSHPLPLSAGPLPPPDDTRRVYEELLVRATRYAQGLVPEEQAFEIGHDVAVELLHRPPEQITPTLVYLRVTSRLRDLRRATTRRAAIEAEYMLARPDAAPAWMRPGAGLDARELLERIESTLATMPAAMREVFRLVRGEELSYREAAERLGVGVGTVHTHLSRANALLHECVEAYHADRSATVPAGSPTRPER